MKKYMSYKPIKKGFKISYRNDSATEYLFQFDIYSGRKGIKKGRIGKNVVMQLSHFIHNFNHNDVRSLSPLKAIRSFIIRE